MGHVRLLVQEQGFDLSRAIRTLDCAWGWEGGGGCLTGHCILERRECQMPGVSLPVITFVSDITLILVWCSVVSAKMACLTVGVSCTVRVFELLHFQSI